MSDPGDEAVDGKSSLPSGEALLSAMEQEGVRKLGDWVAEEYSELRHLARQVMSRERAGHTLSATALLHEACVRLLKAKRQQEFAQRKHFFAALRQAMSHVLIEHARHRKTTVAGNAAREAGDHALDLLVDSLAKRNIECVDFAQALEELSKEDSRGATAISLYYFFDWKQKEIAEYLDVSLATIEKDLAFAKTYLRGKLEHGR